MPQKNIDLILLWHFHQPDYRDRVSGQFALPWTYLHATKDYADMANHLERHPGVRAVINTVPVLLDQIEEYASQIAQGDLRDPLLRMLVTPDLGQFGDEERNLLLESCLRGNRAQMIDPFPPYRRLLDMHRLVDGAGNAGRRYLSGTYLSDLITWYHLSWTGETERRREPLIAELMAKGQGYTHADRVRLLDLIGRQLRNLVPRYRALAEAGRIELSTTFYAHPIVPLLIDFAAARESLPDLALPRSPRYPGGRERAASHLERALASHERRFGARPLGVWPSEGALSDETVALLARHGIAWSASSESVLAASLRREGRPDALHEGPLYRPHRLESAPGVALFFRDERLSDLIGFEYAKWQGDDAARNLVGLIESAGDRAAGDGVPVVCVMLDGENAWEYYPYNAYYFFEELYTALERHPHIRTTTPAACLREQPHRAAALKSLVAGSWVYGNLSTWIGSPAKNRAWDLLCSAKQSFDMAVAGGRLTPAECEQAQEQLMACEGSDWFWWLGDDNPDHSVASFDQLYRSQLANLYALLKLTPPPDVGEPLCLGRGSPEAGGTMRRAHG